MVGPLRPDGKHEVATVLQELELHDDVELEPAAELAVEGFADDAIVRAALETLAAACGVEARWHARIQKRIPVAAGLGGGSADAAAALRLANELVPEPVDASALHALAARLGADVPFCIAGGTQLGRGDGTELAPLDLPTDYAVLLVLPDGETKGSTASVYARFDERNGAPGFDERRATLLDALARVERAGDLAHLPPNDLASSPLADELRARGAFRADVTGAGPAVYGLFDDEAAAERAARALGPTRRTWLTRPRLAR